MRILSLFDGMSCGQIALRDMGIVPEVYYASEVDKFAIAQTQLNFPDTIQLGDVRLVYPTQLGHIDLLIGGSPCQSFSFAGKRVGMATKENEKVLTLDRYLELKEQGFEFEGQSYLFWEYMRILTELRRLNPNVKFLLENVKMKKEWEAVLTEAIGVPGVHINSALVSAQNRKRIYWTNIGEIAQPEDRGLLLRDVLQTEVDEKYFLSIQDDKYKHVKILNGGCIGGTYRAFKDERCFRPFRSSEKSVSIMARARMDGCGQACCKIIINGEPRIRRLTPTECARLQTIPEWYTWQCSETQQYKMLGNGWTVEVIKHIFSYL